eukprot:COSAG06_NODE_4025_length_4608_cov_2.342637_3_plen_87_part_00
MSTEDPARGLVLVVTPQSPAPERLLRLIEATAATVAGSGGFSSCQLEFRGKSCEQQGQTFDRATLCTARCMVELVVERLTSGGLLP